MAVAVNAVGNLERVVIVGGGLAGLAAGVRLADAGYQPIILEKRPFLGGRAYSFTDPETGAEVDNGQHVFVGACEEYKSFLHRVGAWGNVRIPRRLDAPVLMNGIQSRLSAAPLPGALGNLAALLRYGHLTWKARIRLLYGLARLRMVRLGAAEGALDQVTFHDWLVRHRQSSETIERFWNLITLPALNDDVRDVSAAAGIMLFQVALFGPTGNAAIGYPVVGLSRLAGDAASEFIQRRGGQVLTGMDVVELMPQCQSAARLADGSLVEGRAIISAVPANTLTALLGEIAGHDFFAPAAGIKASPIVGVHIWYDRPVMDANFVATIGGNLQWVFNVTGMQGGDDSGGQHIAISLSGAWKWKDVEKSELRDLFVAEMARVFPKAAAAEVRRFLVVKMLEATFRVTPGAQSLRLPQETPINGLFLAGDWTRTGWPSTMESAVRSGNLAADAASRFLARERT